MRPLLRTLAAVAFALSFAPSLAAAAPTSSPTVGAHSPMTEAVVKRLKAVLASSRGARDAFVKIGDSNTANPGFLGCFSGTDVHLGEHADLETSRAFFAAHAIDGARTSFDRVSTSATIGWLTRAPLQGIGTSHLAQEIGAVKPAFAVIMLGTNDDRPGGFADFQKNLAAVVDRTLAMGVIPLLSTIPPRLDTPEAGARVPEMNAAIRALAASRQIPLMDLHAALLPLPRHGLVGDGIHLASFWQKGVPHACWMTGAALESGMNVRNLLVLEALDRARRFVAGDEAPETDATPRS